MVGKTGFVMLITLFTILTSTRVGFCISYSYSDYTGQGHFASGIVNVNKWTPSAPGEVLSSVDMAFTGQLEEFVYFSNDPGYWNIASDTYFHSNSNGSWSFRVGNPQIYDTSFNFDVDTGDVLIGPENLNEKSGCLYVNGALSITDSISDSSFIGSGTIPFFIEMDTSFSDRPVVDTYLQSYVLDISYITTIPPDPGPDPAPVPEPSTVLLISAGMAVAALLKRKLQ